LARRHHRWISAGCLEKDGDKVYNSAVIIDRSGRIVLKHRKIDTLPWLTKDLYDLGNPEDIRTVDTEFGRLGLTICADNFNLKNPQRVADQGAWLLIVSHGFAVDELETMATNSLCRFKIGPPNALPLISLPVSIPIKRSSNNNCA
jgi:predicted amidohydrolase